MMNSDMLIYLKDRDRHWEEVSAYCDIAVNVRGSYQLGALPYSLVPMRVLGISEAAGV